MALCAMMGTATLTSCEGTLDDVFGEWSRPTKTETTPSIEETPLTIEAVEAGTIQVYYSGSHTLPKPITYAKNGVSTSITASTDIAVAAGDVVSFSSENSSLGDATNYVFIQADHKCYVYGNMMSMINDEGDFSKDKTISGEYALRYMLYGNENMYNHPDKKLILPATTLSEGCYWGLFRGCYSLSKAPELPATKLAPLCYGQMFRYCTALTTAPELPATTLDEDCYYEMFYNCTALSIAPVLPATTLAEECYYEMFGYCTGLTTAPELPATTLTPNCYDSMFAYCTGLTTAPKLPATTLDTQCYSGMFWECTGLTTAPELPATTLAMNCYEYMFLGCKGLTTAPELPATTLAQDCYLYMFNNCVELTTAPVLSAPTLVNGCYSCMFKGCSKLSSVSCKATSEINSTNLKEWLDSAGGSATSPILHVTTGKESESWNLPTTPGTWTVKGDL